MSIEKYVNEYIDENSLSMFTSLIVGYIDTLQSNTINNINSLLLDIKNELSSITDISNMSDIDGTKERIAAAISSMGYTIQYTDISEVTWEMLIDGIKRIPVDTFAKPRDPADISYPLPKAYQSWGSNVAFAYDYAMQFHETIVNNNGIASIVGESSGVRYHGFYAIEYALSVLSYDNSTLDYTLTVDRRREGENYPDAYMINITNAEGSNRMIEWEDSEQTAEYNQKKFHLKLSELPQDGRLFLFGLFKDDQYYGKVPYTGSGKVLLIGGHPLSIETALSSNYGPRFDDGVIQLFKTGEPYSMNKPFILESKLDETPNVLYVLVNDYHKEEENASLSFEADFEFTDTSKNAHIIYALSYDPNTRWWYAILDDDCIGYSNYKLYDKLYDNETEYPTKYLVGNIYNTTDYVCSSNSSVNLDDENSTVLYPWISNGGDIVYTESPMYLISPGDKIWSLSTVLTLISQKNTEIYESLVISFLDTPDDTVNRLGYTSPDMSVETQKRVFSSASEVKSTPIIVDTDGFSIDIDTPYTDVNHGTDFLFERIYCTNISLRTFGGNVYFTSIDHNTGSSNTDNIDVNNLLQIGKNIEGTSNTNNFVYRNYQLYELGLNGLERIDYPSRTTTSTSISYGLALECARLRELSLPNLVYVNGFLASSCAGLYSVTADNLTELNGYVAANCDKLTRVNLKNLNTVRTTYLFDKSSVRNMVFDNLETIDLLGAGDTIFMYSKCLQNVTFNKPISIYETNSGGRQTILMRTDMEELNCAFTNGVGDISGTSYSLVGNSPNLIVYNGVGQNKISCRTLSNRGMFYNCALLDTLNLSDVVETVGTGYLATSCPMLRKIVFGQLTNISSDLKFDANATRLIHIEFGEGTSANIILSTWNPTVAMVDDITENLLEENTIDTEKYNETEAEELRDILDLVESNLTQFLWNFYYYIVERLADMTGNEKTITLSSAVKSVIQGTDETSKALVWPSTDNNIATMITTKLAEKGWSIA